MNQKNTTVSQSFPLAYHQSLGLRTLIEVAMGDQYVKNISPDITEQRFQLAGSGYRTVVARVVPFLNSETPEEAASRLCRGKFANTGDLAVLLLNHPEEIERWAWVTVIGTDSRWQQNRDEIYVPAVSIVEAQPQFGLSGLRSRLFPTSGILMLDQV